MPLGAPAITGPISTCSTSVRVFGQYTGSRVRIFIEGDANPIGDAVVGWSDAFVAVDRSRLVVGRKLFATQMFEGETSRPSPSGQVVEAAVNGSVAVPFRIHQCAQSLFVTDCCPGARLDVLQGGVLLGSATAVADQAWIDFQPGMRIQPVKPVEIRQFICTSATPVSTFSAAPLNPLVFRRNRLASPLIIEPLEECQRVVPLTKIVEGAAVRLLRRGQPVYDNPVPVPDVSVIVERLVAGEVFEVVQSMPRCEVRADVPTKAEVKSLTALPQPRIDGPLCKGPHQVVLSRLKPGATIRMFRGATELGHWEAAAKSMPVDVDVPGPATITVQQELCGIVSPMSRGYTVATRRSGRWFVVEDAKGENLLAESFAVHVALDRTGHIVMFSGDQHNGAQNAANPQDIDHCERFDTSDLTVKLQ